MKKLWQAFRSVSWGYLWLAIILSGSGFLLLVYPGQSMKTIAYTIGAAAFLLGLLQLIRVLSRKERGFRFAIAVLCAALTMICGILACVLNEGVQMFFPALIGLFLVMDAAFKLQTVVRSYSYKMKAFWVLLIFSVLTVAGGFLCIRSESFAISTLAVLLGITLMLDGIQNLLSLLFLDILRGKDAKAGIPEAAKKEEGAQ